MNRKESPLDGAINQAIKSVAQEQGFKVADLAPIAGVSVSTIYRRLDLDIGFPVSVVAQMAHAMGVTLTDIFARAVEIGQRRGVDVSAIK